MRCTVFPCGLWRIPTTGFLKRFLPDAAARAAILVMLLSLAILPASPPANAADMPAAPSAQVPIPPVPTVPGNADAQVRRQAPAPVVAPLPPAAKKRAAQDRRPFITLKDSLGHSARVRHPVQRIVVLYAAFGEILYELNAGDTLVARTAADTDPEVAHLPSIGTHMNPNLELVASLKPDLVLQLAGRRDAALQSEQLRSLGVPVLDIDMNSFEKMFTATRLIAKAVGRDREARPLITEWRGRLDVLKRLTQGKKKLRVFFEVRYPHLLGAGGEHIVGDIIRYAGGNNVLDHQDRRLVRLNEEILIMTEPEVYIIQRGPMNPAPKTLADRPLFDELVNIDGRVLLVDEEVFSRPGPHSIQAAEILNMRLREFAGEKIEKAAEVAEAAEAETQSAPGPASLADRPRYALPDEPEDPAGAQPGSAPAGAPEGQAPAAPQTAAPAPAEAPAPQAAPAQAPADPAATQMAPQGAPAEREDGAAPIPTTRLPMKDTSPSWMNPTGGR